MRSSARRLQSENLHHVRGRYPTKSFGNPRALSGQALAAGKKIIACTIQTFPFALESVQDMAPMGLGITIDRPSYCSPS